MANRDEVEDLLALARARPMQPSQALMARVLADALAEQPKAAGAMAGAGRAAVRRPARRGWLAVGADLFGGFGGLAGVGGAAVAGLVLGFLQPAPVTEMADAVLGVGLVAVDLMPTTDNLLAGE